MDEVAALQCCNEVIRGRRRRRRRRWDGGRRRRKEGGHHPHNLWAAQVVRRDIMPKKTYQEYETSNLLILAYLALFGLWLTSYYVLIPVPVNLIATSTLIVFIGSHRSLSLLQTGADGKVVVERETLTKKDAMMFPIIASVALGGLYLVLKYNKDIANLLLSVYFSIVGTFTLMMTAAPIIETVVPSSGIKYGPKPFKIPILGEVVDLQRTLPELIALIPAVIFSIFYLKTKHFMLNNVLGISFCVQTIERVSIGSYAVGAVLLIGLFFYDIYWVFNTDVMVTVAKSFDGPIKILFRRVTLSLYCFLVFFLPPSYNILTTTFRHKSLSSP